MLMEQAGLSIVRNEDDLKRKYISKLPTDLRRAVLSQAWPLDGPEKPPRRPFSWFEAAEIVEMELETRADTVAPMDQVNSLYGGYVAPQDETGVPTGTPTRKCQKCQRPGHFDEACPVQAAKLRNEYNKAIAESTRTGKFAPYVGMGTAGNSITGWAAQMPSTPSRLITLK